ncbi:MAG TPA: hypothetical protein VJY39_17030 [Acidisphaera sp.]|nr:hypothetical protein [Acidisphaera sp.]
MSIGANQPFRPAGTATLAAGTASASVALTGTGGTVLVTNATNAVAFVRLGTSAAVTATPADMPVLPNSRIVLAANSSIQHAAAILASGSGEVFFSVGDGTP